MSSLVKSGQVRPVVICLFSRDGSILVVEGRDPRREELLYRPLGGEIRFGEYSQAALIREVREELEAEISQPRYLGTLESMFSYDGQPGHELVLVYDAAFVDPVMYDRSEFSFCEDNLFTFRAMWKPLADFYGGSCQLYPVGLVELLQKHGYE